MLSSTECYTWLAVLMTESVVIVTFNAMTIIVFMRTRSLRKRNMYLVINLAVADKLAGGFSEFMLFIFTGAYCNLWKYNVSGSWHRIRYAIELLFPVSSLTTIVAISLQQMHATYRPFRHRVIKKWVYGVAIAVVWVVAAWVATACLVGTNYLYFWISFNSICLFVICVSYTATAVKLYRGAHPQHHGAANRTRKLTVTLFIMTLLSLLMWLPYVTCTFLYLTSDSFRSLSKLTSFRLNYALIILYYANSLVNPILYAIRIREFKRTLGSLLRCRSNQVADIPMLVLPPG